MYFRQGGYCQFMAITLDPATTATAATRAENLAMAVDFFINPTMELVLGVYGIICYLSFPSQDQDHGILFMLGHVLSELGVCSEIVMLKREEMSQHHQLSSAEFHLCGMQMGLGVVEALPDGGPGVALLTTNL